MGACGARARRSPRESYCIYFRLLHKGFGRVFLRMMFDEGSQRRGWGCERAARAEGWISPESARGTKGCAAKGHSHRRMADAQSSQNHVTSDHGRSAGRCDQHAIGPKPYFFLTPRGSVSRPRANGFFSLGRAFRVCVDPEPGEVRQRVRGRRAHVPRPRPHQPGIQ